MLNMVNLIELPGEINEAGVAQDIVHAQAVVVVGGEGVCRAHVGAHGPLQPAGQRDAVAGR